MLHFSFVLLPFFFFFFCQYISATEEKKKNRKNLLKYLSIEYFFLYKTFKLFYLVYHELHLPSLSNG